MTYIKNIFLRAIQSLSRYLILAYPLWIYANSASPENYINEIYLIGVIGILIPLSDLGLSTYLTREIVRKEIKKTDYLVIFISVSLITSILTSALGFIFLEYFESKIAFITLGIVSYVIVDSHFRANSNYYFLALISIMSFVFYVLTFNKSSPEDAFLSYFILWFLLMLTLSLNFKVNTLSRVKEMLISSLPIFLSTFLFVLTFKIDLYFLKKLNLDEYIFGFEILDKISILIWSIVGLMCQVMFVNKVEKNESIHSIITNRREFYTIFFALIFVFISFFILLNYADAWNIPILLSLFFSIFTIIRVFNIVIIQLFYYAQNAESLVLKLYTVAAMINISLNIPLSYFFEATGLMISTVIASIFVLYNLIINEKNV